MIRVSVIKAKRDNTGRYQPIFVSVRLNATISRTFLRMLRCHAFPTRSSTSCRAFAHDSTVPLAAAMLPYVLCNKNRAVKLHV